MQAIRKTVRAEEDGVIRLSGLPVKAGESVEVLITSPPDVDQRRTAAAEMRTLMDRAGKLAKERGLTEDELAQLLATE